MKRTIALIGIVALSACTSSTVKDSASDKKYEAFDVCTQFVKDRLKAPGNATFRDPTADNGDTTFKSISNGAGYVISSSVDSENGFGAKLRSTWQCGVTHVSGDKWKLVKLNIQDGGD